MPPNNPMTEGEALAVTARPQDVALLPCPFCGLDVTDDEGCFPLNRERTKWEVRCGNPSCFAHDPCDDSRHAAIARWNRRSDAALASAQAREEELRAACDKWSERELLFGAHEDLQARAERAEASAERWRSRYIAEVVCYRMDQHGDTASEALDAANAVAEKLGHLDKARDALSTNAATQTGETNEAAE